MSSACSAIAVWAPPWSWNPRCFLSARFIKKGANLVPCRIVSSLKDDSSSSPKHNQLGYDTSEELFRLDVDIPSSDVTFGAQEPRSWFGPNGQYIRELPCPSCRGRGYTPCTECGIDRSRQDCSLCGGKGIMTCQQCLGECVIWEESIDERPWEKARSISPLKVKEDDEVDKLDLEMAVKKKSKRIYQSTSPEVGQKISRSLKSLNERTGLFTKRMKIIHRDPALHAQRVAAIKKAKGTAAARKHASETLKIFFSDPENRRKRSLAMKGIKYHCKNCGREGHRTYYCPELRDKTGRRFICGLCGQKGHNRRTCRKLKTSSPKNEVQKHYRCRICRQLGHNRRTCSQRKSPISNNTSPDSEKRTEKRHHCHCHNCGQIGHNRRTCHFKPDGNSNFKE